MKCITLTLDLPILLAVAASKVSLTVQKVPAG